MLPQASLEWYFGKKNHREDSEFQSHLCSEDRRQDELFEEVQFGMSIARSVHNSQQFAKSTGSKNRDEYTCSDAAAQEIQ